MVSLKPMTRQMCHEFYKVFRTILPSATTMNMCTPRKLQIVILITIPFQTVSCLQLWLTTKSWVNVS